jgi:hypothetical protein
MPMKSGLSAAAFVTLVTMGAMATTSANAFPLVATQGSGASRLCDQAVSSKACTEHMIYLEILRSRLRRGDTSPSYIRNTDPATIKPCVMQVAAEAAVVVVVAAGNADIAD